MNAYQGKVCLELRRSRCLPRALLALHAASVLFVLYCWPLTAASGLWSSLVLAHGAWQWRRLARATQWPRRLEIDGDGRWRLQLADGSLCEARFVHAPLVLPWLVSVELREADGRRRDLLLLPDMLDADAFRRLRVRITHLGAG